MGAVDQIPVASKDFHLQEYESLKKEVSEQVEHTRKLEIYAAGGIAAFYSWFIGAKSNLPPELLIIPLLLAILGAWRSWAALMRIKEIVVYLVQIEKVFALSEQEGQKFGWETHHESNSSSPFLLSGAAFWGVLVLVTGAAWLILGHFGCQWIGITGNRGTLSMTPDQVQLYTFWLRLAALLVSIVGIVLVLRQLRQVGATILGNAFSSSFAELREIHKVFIEHPELRPYFYDNALPPDSETQRARAVAEMFLDAFIHMHLLRPRFPEELKPHIDLLIKDMVFSSAFLANYLKENIQFIPPGLRSVVLRLIEARKQEAESAPNPGPPADR